MIDWQQKWCLIEVKIALAAMVGRRRSQVGRAGDSWWVTSACLASPSLLDTLWLWLWIDIDSWVVKIAASRTPWLVHRCSMHKMYIYLSMPVQASQERSGMKGNKEIESVRAKAQRIHHSRLARIKWTLLLLSGPGWIVINDAQLSLPEPRAPRSALDVHMHPPTSFQLGLARVPARPRSREAGAQATAQALELAVLPIFWRSLSPTLKAVAPFLAPAGNS